MAARGQKHDKPLLKAALVGAISLVALMEAPPLYVAGYDVIRIAALGGLVFSVPPLLALALMITANWVDTVEARIPTNAKKHASFAKSIRELKGRARFPKKAPYWGKLNGKAVFAPVEANALILGPAGSSKDVSHAGPNLAALAGKANKVVMDLKSDMMVIYADLLRAAGETVICLNFGGLFEDRIKGEDSDNALSVILTSFTSGSLSDISADAIELSLELYPEPAPGNEGPNGIFRKGSRKIIVFSMIILVIIEGEDATLGGVLALISDRDLLLKYTRWASGRLIREDGGLARFPIFEAGFARSGQHDPQDLQNFADYLSGLGGSIADLMESKDSRTFDSFLEGAIVEMVDFNITTRAAKRTKTSTFDLNELLKADNPFTIFIGGDSSRTQAYRKIIEITVSNIIKRLLRARDNRRPTYIFANEVTSFRIRNLSQYLVYLRASRIRFFLYVQSLASYREAYGKDALQTLLSETEVKYILPGQRDPETLKMLEELLGKKKVVKRSNSGNRRDGSDGLSGLDGYSYSEESVPLLTADQIRRLNKGILLLGKNKPALIDTPSIASIWPFRRKEFQAISPFYDKVYRERVRLILWRYLPLAVRLFLKRVGTKR